MIDGAPSASPESHIHVSVEPEAGNLWQIRLEGPLPVDWAAALASGLARASLNVIAAEAAKGPMGRWHVRITVYALSEPPSPPLLHAMLTGANRAEALGPPRLDQVTLCMDSAHGGSVCVEVQGPDRVGFLGGLLRLMAGLTLFPVELRVRTHDDRVHDRVWLKGLGGRRPADSVVHVLERQLDALRIP